MRHWLGVMIYCHNSQSKHVEKFMLRCDVTVTQKKPPSRKQDGFVVSDRNYAQRRGRNLGLGWVVSTSFRKSSMRMIRSN